MLQKYNTYKILELFFDFPTKNFQLREISRRVKLGLPSVINHVKLLEKEEFIKKEKGNIYDNYKANKTSKFKLYKKTNLLLRLDECGLLYFLKEKLTPDVIVLFGSAVQGNDVEESDIDLFILAKKKDLNLKPFEEKLNREINLFFEEKLGKLPKELMNNIINGIVLSGYLRVLK
ncbi:MAG: nucleotidyltransferase domain-containing protein [Nanoarchaeota archaeon]|nr:nucleotidyltransferase domain-containing protein [Nanoarchaeota archaeon]